MLGEEGSCKFSITISCSSLVGLDRWCVGSPVWCYCSVDHDDWADITSATIKITSFLIKEMDHSFFTVNSRLVTENVVSLSES